MIKDYSEYTERFNNIPRGIRKDDISMKEVKENIKKTINDSCEWVQRELQSRTMSQGKVASIPETLKAISELTKTLEKLGKY